MVTANSSVNQTLAHLPYSSASMAIVFWFRKHLYANHLEQVELQLSRDERPLPRLVIKRKPDSLFDYRFDDFEVTGYDPHPAIKAPVAV